MRLTWFSLFLAAIILVASPAAHAGNGISCTGPLHGFFETGREKNVVRVAFDRFGNTHPRDPNHKSCYASRNDKSFYLKDEQENQRRWADDEVHQQAALRAVEAAIKETGANHIVFLIHGFNHTYSGEGGAIAENEILRNRITELKPSNLNILFVETYWDGGKTGIRFIRTWRTRLVHSKLAGQIGLRALLSGIPSDMPVTMVTKSAGASVALSSVVNPEWNCPRAPNALDRVRRRTLHHSERYNTNIRRGENTSLLMLAPAVGNGHLNIDVSPLLNESEWDANGICRDLKDDILVERKRPRTKQAAERFGRIAFTVNTKDLATTKVLEPFERLLGDTGLNSDEEFAEKVANSLRVGSAGMPGASVLIEKMKFWNHKTGRYINEPTQSKGHKPPPKAFDCMLGFVGLAQRQLGCEPR